MIHQMEELRKQYRNRWIASFLLCALAFFLLILMMGLWQGSMSRGPGGGAVITVPLFVAFFSYRKQKQLYVNEFRSLFLESMSGDGIEIIESDAKGGFSAEDLLRWGVLQGFDEAESTGIIRGKVNGSSFAYASVQTYRREKNMEVNAKKIVLPVFQGIYLIVEMKEKTEGKVIIRPKSLLEKTVDVQTATKDEAFDQRYAVESEYQHRADLLNQKMKEKILNLELGTAQYTLGIVDGWWHLAVNGRRRMIEPGLFDQVNTVFIHKMEREYKMLNQWIHWLSE